MQKRTKKVYSALVLCLLGLIGISGVIINKVESKPREIKVGITVYDGEDAFIHNTKESILDNIEEINAKTKLSIMVEVVDGQHNQSIQNRQIDHFIKEGYDLLIVNTVERIEASTIIDKAQNANIPVIFYNREPVPQDMKKWNQLYYVGSKAEEAGAIQGEILADALDNGLKVDTNGDGKIQYVMIEGEYGHQDAILRTYHCIRVLEERGYVMENLATDTGMWRKEEGAAKMRQWYETFGEQIEVVLANNDEMAMGAIEVLESYGYFQGEKWIPVLGVDGIEEAVEAIGDGKMLGTVYNDWEEQAKCITHKMYQLLTGIDYEIDHEEEGNYFWVKHGKITVENSSTLKNHTIKNKK